MSTIAKHDKKGKGMSDEATQQVSTDRRMEAVDAKVALIQALIPLGLAAVQGELEAEVKQLAGVRYQRRGRQPVHVRWTKQNGSVYLGDQKVPIRYTRVRDLGVNAEVPLETYRKFQGPRGMDERLLRRCAFVLTDQGIFRPELEGG